MVLFCKMLSDWWRIDPANSSWVDLWVSDPSGIYSYIDKSGDPSVNLADSAFTQIAMPSVTGAFYGLAFAPSPVPEPSALILTGAGAFCLMVVRRRRGNSE